MEKAVPFAAYVDERSALYLVCRSHGISVNCTSRVRPFIPGYVRLFACHVSGASVHSHVRLYARPLMSGNPPFEDVHPPSMGVNQPFIRVVLGVQVARDFGELHVPGTSVYMHVRLYSRGFRVQGVGVRVQGVWVWVQGVWVRVQGVGVRVQGVGS